ncbi:hypothetical protein [Reyranella sp.]|uniref:hypothetical protein n=1 Tax=Reyranella sp. TaxID=1929291 RepID=UPI003783E7C9
MSRHPNTPAAEPAGTLPMPGTPRTVLMVEANAMLGEFVLYFAAGPQGKHSNIKAEVYLTPDDAERLARQILDDLADFPARIAAVSAALAGGAR